MASTMISMCYRLHSRTTFTNSTAKKVTFTNAHEIYINSVMKYQSFTAFTQVLYLIALKVKKIMVSLTMLAHLRMLEGGLVEWSKKPHVWCFRPPLFILKWQCIHKDFLHYRRRRHQVLQFQVEDALQALCAQSPQFRQFAQKARLIVGLRPAQF